jgi:hypothetical protein
MESFFSEQIIRMLRNVEVHLSLNGKTKRSFGMISLEGRSSSLFAGQKGRSLSRQMKEFDFKLREKGKGLFRKNCEDLLTSRSVPYEVLEAPPLLRAKNQNPAGTLVQ